MGNNDIIDSTAGIINLASDYWYQNLSPGIWNHYEGFSSITNIRYMCAFSDGSYNKKTNTVGVGLVLILLDDEFRTLKTLIYWDEVILFGNKLVSSMHQVGGEIYGALLAARITDSEKIPNFHLYYDYKGVECWPTGKWKAKNSHTEYYSREMRDISDKYSNESFRYIKVPAHSGMCIYNDLADILAKNGAGIYIDIEEWIDKHLNHIKILRETYRISPLKIELISIG